MCQVAQTSFKSHDHAYNQPQRGSGLRVCESNGKVANSILPDGG